MKRALLVLAILLMAATSYNQTSRRTTNANGSATRNSEGTTTTRSQSSNSSTNATSTSTRASDDHRNNQGQNRENNKSGSQVQSNHSNDNRSNGDRNRYDNHNYNHSQNNNYSHNRYNESANSHHHSNEVYVSYPSTRVYHGTHVVRHAYREAPYDRNYRAVHYVYREPNHVNIYWTSEMHRHYIDMYPEISYWHYYDGYRINSVSAYYADNYVGEVMNVYGKVTDVYYSFETDEFFLYFGAYYPYHDFTIVMPGTIARRFNNVPEYYFTDQYINVTGLITAFNGKPEIVVKRNFQLAVY